MQSVFLLSVVFNPSFPSILEVNQFISQSVNCALILLSVIKKQLKVNNNNYNCYINNNNSNNNNNNNNNSNNSDCNKIFSYGGAMFNMEPPSFRTTV